MTNEQFNALVSLIDAKLNSEAVIPAAHCNNNEWLTMLVVEHEAEATARLLLVNGTPSEAQALQNRMAAEALKNGL